MTKIWNWYHWAKIKVLARESCSFCWLPKKIWSLLSSASGGILWPVACCRSMYFEAIISNYWRIGSNWMRYSNLPTASLMKYSLFPLWMLLVLTWMNYSIKNFCNFLSPISHQRNHQLQKILVSGVPNNSSSINKFVSSGPRCINGKYWKSKSPSHRNIDASIRLYLWSMGP